ncbi:macro domain-containing protein [Aeropyrum camini]|uniref:Predicted phosphatase n=1 Tax=Aeropyrum camini SY1 = JCM 12091 TaxID=1198449 RepID=U3TEW0_9CREN|nr:macro domain-containing protein [Aeropyrum camini]BAN90503.1 predicted phosphatase [Aeropyrum camini SY1 = JCM 12091]
MKCWSLGGRILAVVTGDLTKVRVEAVVNPANSLMIMGGGAAGALKRAGGRVIEEEAMRKAPVPVGEAVITGGGSLPARFVIHAPTMEEPGMRIPLVNAFKASYAALRLASGAGIESVAMPAMGAGVGGLSVADVAREAAMAASILRGRWPRYVVLVARGEEAYRAMEAGVRDALGVEGGDCPADLARLV